MFVCVLCVFCVESCTAGSAYVCLWRMGMFTFHLVCVLCVDHGVPICLCILFGESCASVSCLVSSVLSVMCRLCVLCVRELCACMSVLCVERSLSCHLCLCSVLRAMRRLCVLHLESCARLSNSVCSELSALCLSCVPVLCAGCAGICVCSVLSTGYVFLCVFSGSATEDPAQPVRGPSRHGKGGEYPSFRVTAPFRLPFVSFLMSFALKVVSDIASNVGDFKNILITYQAYRNQQRERVSERPSGCRSPLGLFVTLLF